MLLILHRQIVPSPACKTRYTFEHLLKLVHFQRNSAIGLKHAKYTFRVKRLITHLEKYLNYSIGWNAGAEEDCLRFIYILVIANKTEWTSKNRLVNSREFIDSRDGFKVQYWKESHTRPDEAFLGSRNWWWSRREKIARDWSVGVRRWNLRSHQKPKLLHEYSEKSDRPMTIASKRSWSHKFSWRLKKNSFLSRFCFRSAPTWRHESIPWHHIITHMFAKSQTKNKSPREASTMISLYDSIVSVISSN